jgi:hypothetical protein
VWAPCCWDLVEGQKARFREKKKKERRREKRKKENKVRGMFALVIVCTFSTCDRKGRVTTWLRVFTHLEALSLLSSSPAMTTIYDALMSSCS